jgi:hypothetical protein
VSLPILSSVAGSLLAILNGRLQVVPRAEGEATVHDSEVFHAVSAMRSGARYTLIMCACRRSNILRALHRNLFSLLI